MQAVYLALVYVAILTIGLTAPFALSLGYVWDDIFSPQLIASSILNAVPASLIMAGAALGAYLLADRRDPPRVNAITVITLMFAAWVTLTTLWAVAPDSAWSKWDWAFKNLLVSAFLPFVFRSRVQIEAFLLVVVLSLAGHFLPYGLKNFLSGGGYGRNFGLIPGNGGISEGSTFAGLCVMTIPLMLYFKDHGIILPRARWVRTMWWGLIVACVSAVISTYERTGLVALAVVGVHVWLTSKRKLLVGGLLAALVVVGSGMLAASYAERISTIGSYDTDESAVGRILVWKWTLGFVSDHPLGGGFNAYLVNSFVMPLANGETAAIHGKAFHSIYFEALGEHGLPGFAMFISLLALSFLALWRVRRRTRGDPGLAWAGALATQVMGSLAVLMTAGLFISNALQPEFPYLFASAVCLSQYVRRAVRAQAAGAPKVAAGWSRAMAPGGYTPSGAAVSRTQS